jgi:ubiquinone biosynthesis accessory factor UbiJ
MLAEFLFRPFELFLNRGLQQSTTAQVLARALEGRTLGLTVDGTPFDLRLKLAGERLSVMLPDGAAPDACIGGSLLSLGRLLREDPQAPVRDGAVRMTGDTEIAEQFRQLLRFATPDLEEELSRLVGDPIAHQAGNAARAFAGWTEAAGRTMARSMSEYLQEESRILPTHSEVREFAGKVDDLVNDVARAEARIERLKEGL